MFKGALIILLFSGQTVLKPFEYEAQELNGEQGITNSEIVISCEQRATELRESLAEHRWNDPRGQGWYLRDGRGTIQGSIC